MLTQSASAQHSSNLGTPAESKTGQSSVSTYSRDKIETANLANGNLSLSIPLVTVGGRGAASYTIALAYNSKVWSAQSDPDPENCPSGPQCPQVIHHSAMYEKIVEHEEPYLQHLGGGWTIALAPGIKAKVIGIDRVIRGCNNAVDCGPKYALTKMWLTLPDGSQVELRDNLTDGAPALTPDSNGMHGLTDQDRGRLWHSVDGSNVTFVHDTAIDTDYTLPSGWVFLPDGTRMRMDAGVCSKIIDSDGNFITISGNTYTDELGRQTVVQTVGGTVTVTAKGYMGLPDRSMTINTGEIGSHLRSDFNNPALYPRPFTTGDYLHNWDGTEYPHMIQGDHTDLFPNSEGVKAYQSDVGDDVGARTAVTQLNLLDGRSFQFHYNQYGEVAEIIYPGGGVSQIDYQGYPSGICEVSTPMQATFNRRVSQRRAWADGAHVDAAHVDATWVYAKGFGTVNGTDYPTVTVEVHQGNETGALLSSSRHFFYALNAEYRVCVGAGLQRYTGSGNEIWYNAKEFRTETQTGNGTVVTTRNWVRRANVGWPSSNPYLLEHGQDQTSNDDRVDWEETTLEDGQTKRVEYDYDQFNNVTSIREYAFGTAGTPGALLRETVREYLGSGTNVSLNGYCYTNLNPTDSACGSDLATDINSIIYQRHLLLNETIKDGQHNQKARTVYEYDNYTGANHAAVVANIGMTYYDGSRFSAFSSQHEPRGNVTAISRLSEGTSTYITAYSQYDNAGNVIWTKDPKGYVSTVSYADDFGAGDNPGGGVAGPNGATYAFPTLATNALGQVVKTQYNYTLGAATGVKDPNSTIARTEYDSIGRPFRVTTALGLTEQAVTEMIYPTATSNVSTVSKQLDTNGANGTTRWLASKAEMDGFDRVVTAYQAEDGQPAASATFTILSKTVYDGLGRVRQVSNPYRSGDPGSPLYTTTEYDVAGRVVKVKTPDNAEVNTYYNSTQTLVKDQAGKERMSETNALGRLTYVWEITAAEDWTEAVSFPNHPEVTAGYKTSYAYDVLDNLKTVTQAKGTTNTKQTRSFEYDTLSRLTSATNPESGTISYQYDANGNLVLKIDPRTGGAAMPGCSIPYTGDHIATCYEYDALNRVISRSYNDGTQALNYADRTPAVTYTYDTAGNGVSRLASVSSSVSTTNYTSYDALGRVTASSQVTDGITYSMPDYKYNLAGALTSEKYPSGKVVETKYDAAGRVAGVKNQATDPYYVGGAADSNLIKYTVHGAIKDMRLGNGLWEHTIFNIRLQPLLIGLGTTQCTDHDSCWNRFRVDYSYGPLGEDNGNVRQQTITVPDLSGNRVAQVAQVYDYDDLNRLKAATEFGVLASCHDPAGQDAPCWKQTFSYDRFGNRRFDQGQDSQGHPLTTLPAIDPNNPALTNPQISLSNNQISDTGYEYDAAGNLKCDATRVCNPTTHAPYYEYDAENKMIRNGGGANPNDPTAASYFYDGDGRRVKKAVGSGYTIFVYDVMGQMVAEYNTSGASGSGTSYLTADSLGTPRIITGADGSVKARHDYLPFGEEIAVGVGGRTGQAGQKYIYGEGDDKVRQKFTQKERDIETGLDYFLARYYSSAQGRFTSPDEFKGGPDEIFALGSGDEEEQALPYAEIVEPQSLNKYQYCLNNPLRYVDPDGHQDVDSAEKRRRQAQGATIHAGITLEKDGRGRMRYDRLSKDLPKTAGGSVARRALAAETKQKLTPLGKGITEILQSVPKRQARSVLTAEQLAQGANKPNAGVTRTGKIFRGVGTALTAISLGISAYNIATAPEGKRGETIASEVGAWGGAIAGGKIGAMAGASIGGAPGAAIGGLLGSAGGAIVGSGIGKALYHGVIEGQMRTSTGFHLGEH